MGEKEIEKVFKQNGYKIVYPEKLTLKNQIKCMGNAKEIVGVSGTGMHMALFAEKGTKITVLER
ncbi:MAG: glycosyltransferase 61 family protein, partial [Alphaproteobacteria bacterium]|nr:glycosyltransferase 61 family protein [Alphaproteobacteria bacterium]